MLPELFGMRGQLAPDLGMHVLESNMTQDFRQIAIKSTLFHHRSPWSCAFPTAYPKTTLSTADRNSDHCTFLSLSAARPALVME